MRPPNSLLVTMLALVLFTLPGSAQRTRRHPIQSVKLEPLKDNTLYEDFSGNVSNGVGSHLFAGLTATGAIRRAVLSFDVAGNVPAGAQILGAKLTLHVTRTISGPQSVSLHLALADWGEGTSNAIGEEGVGATATTNDATWLHTFYPGAYWQVPGGDYASTASATRLVGFSGPHTWASAAMGADVQAWLDSPTTNYGWMLIGAEPPGGYTTAKRFGSGEGTLVLRPQLKIIYELP